MRARRDGPRGTPAVEGGWGSSVAGWAGWGPLRLARRGTQGLVRLEGGSWGTVYLGPPLTLGARGKGVGPEDAGPRPEWEQACRPRTRAWPTLRTFRMWGAHPDLGPGGPGWPAGDEGAPLLRALELGWGWASGAGSPQPTPAGCPTPTSSLPPAPGLLGPIRCHSHPAGT